MAFNESVTDALQRVHIATRTLAIARNAQAAHHRLAVHVPNSGFLIDDVIVALVQRLHEAEHALAVLLAAEGGAIIDPVSGYKITSRLNDRRHVPRRQFVLHRTAQAPAGRRVQFAGAAS
jgi:hypothetical protein